MAEPTYGNDDEGGFVDPADFESFLDGLDQEIYDYIIDVIEGDYE